MLKLDDLEVYQLSMEVSDEIWDLVLFVPASAPSGRQAAPRQRRASPHGLPQTS